MDEAWTCGKGVAAAATLPKMMREAMAAMADTLQEHRRALDLSDPAAGAEDAAYQRVIDAQRAAVGALDQTVREMEAARDVPTARHLEATLNDPSLMAPYARFIAAQRELLQLIQASVAEGEAMLRGDG